MDTETCSAGLSGFHRYRRRTCLSLIEAKERLEEQPVEEKKHEPS